MTVLPFRTEPLLTVAAEDAARTATTDRATQADLILNLAIYDAIDLIREGNVTFARHRLARALASAGRILGSREVGS